MRKNILRFIVTLVLILLASCGGEDTVEPPIEQPPVSPPPISEEPPELPEPPDITELLQPFVGEWVCASFYYSETITRSVVFPLNLFISDEACSESPISPYGITDFITGMDFAPQYWGGMGVWDRWFDVQINTQPDGTFEIILASMQENWRINRIEGEHRFVIDPDNPSEFTYYVNGKPHRMVPFEWERDVRRYRVEPNGRGVRVSYVVGKWAFTTYTSYRVRIYRSDVQGERGEQIWQQQQNTSWHDDDPFRMETLLFHFHDDSIRRGDVFYYSIWHDHEGNEFAMTFGDEWQIRVDGNDIFSAKVPSDYSHDLQHMGRFYHDWLISQGVIETRAGENLTHIPYSLYVDELFYYIADFNNDGILDLAVTDALENLTYFDGSGVESFTNYDGSGVEIFTYNGGNVERMFSFGMPYSAGAEVLLLVTYNDEYIIKTFRDNSARPFTFRRINEYGEAVPFFGGAYFCVEDWSARPESVSFDSTKSVAFYNIESLLSLPVSQPPLTAALPEPLGDYSLDFQHMSRFYHDWLISQGVIETRGGHTIQYFPHSFDVGELIFYMADINNDGILDLAVTPREDSTNGVEIFTYNNGNVERMFSLGMPYSAGSEVMELVTYNDEYVIKTFRANSIRPFTFRRINEFGEAVPFFSGSYFDMGSPSADSVIFNSTKSVAFHDIFC